MKPKLLPFNPTETEIRRAAYFLWEAEGRPAGRDRELWLAARDRLKWGHALRATHARPFARNAQPATRRIR